ncbi:GNAT family N-acetyltransferase, partial [Pantoea agglomerans]|nr:GNAT family N-acetyltransferase [Pantoea agglomerans]
MIEIVSLSDAPQFADQIIDWQWHAFGEATSRAFFASVVNSSLIGADFP